ncbi:MAG: glycoside hydrolase family 3 protein, partial [Brachybacterium tyrofermentans]
MTPENSSPRSPSTSTSPVLSRRAFAVALAGGAVALPAAAHAAPAGRGNETARIDELLAGMSLDQKIGQLFVAVGYGSAADVPHGSNTSTTGVDTIAEIVRTHHVGGLIYFTWSDNLQDIEQIATLSNDVQAAALDSGGIPLIISADEERGVVYRLPAPATPLPGEMALGATGSRAHARKAGDIVGSELRAAGLHQAFAPVVDVNIEAQNPVIGVRSLGADPAAVARLGAAQIKGLQGANCSAAAKHFPGHGDTATDSHLGLPVIDHTREELDAIDLPPFLAAIDEGVDVIMTAHIVVPALDDSGRPATLSHPILTGLLREELGYEGVIVTDSLAMEGVRTLFGDDRVPVEAILAGADQMLMPPDLVVAMDGVREAVAS